MITSSWILIPSLVISAVLCEETPSCQMSPETESNCLELTDIDHNDPSMFVIDAKGSTFVHNFNLDMLKTTERDPHLSQLNHD